MAASLVAVEALVLLCLGALELTSLRSARMTMGVTTSAFFLVAAGSLACCAWGLRQGRRWARGPVVMSQLIQLGLAWNFRDVWSPVLPLGLAVAALVVITGLLHPATTRVLEDDAGA